jgi:serine/threonine-protein kinase
LRRAIPLSVAGLIAAVVAVVIGVAVWQFKPQPPPTEQAITRFTLPLAPGERLAESIYSGSAVAFSPDGKRLVYAATGGNSTLLYLRDMERTETRPIPGTEGGINPFFSPDGEWVGFFVGARLMKVAVQGGTPVLLSAAAPNTRGAAWGPHDTIVVQPLNLGGLSRIPASGGTLQPLTKLDPTKGETSHRWVDFLPSGNAVLFAAGNPGANWDAAKIVAQRLDTGERKILVDGGTYPRYFSGYLLYVRAGVLMAAPFDPERLEVTGPASPIVDGVRESAEGMAQFSVSETGSLAYVLGGLQGSEWTLVSVDRSGRAQPIPAPPRPYEYPRFSPDGQQIAVRAGTDIWVFDIPRETLTRLTFEGVNDYPIWTPDGKRVTFRASRAGLPAMNVFWKNADGTGTEEQLTRSEYGSLATSWSQDGQLLTFSQLHPTNDWDLWLLSIQGDPSAGSTPPATGGSGQAGQRSQSRPFLQTSFFEGGGKFSPDGRYLAYVSGESGSLEVYVQPVSGPGGKWQISTEGGREVAWARNGEIFYRNGNRMMVVDVQTEPTFSAGRPRLLFEGNYRIAPGRSIAGYDISPDGQRFLMIQEGGQDSAPTQIHVVLNWFEELKRRVPTGQ